MTQSEKHIHTAVCRYLDLQYPNVIYFSDASGVRVSIGIAKELKAKRCKKYVIPDLIILQPNKGYHGLIIEIKANKSDVFKKDGEYKNNSHVLAQLQTILRLRELGYDAIFGIGFEECKNIIDLYLFVPPHG